MYHAMYQHADEFGKVRYFNAKIGGFKNETSAIKAIERRGNVGYVTDSNGHALFVIRNGRKIA